MSLVIYHHSCYMRKIRQLSQLAMDSVNLEYLVNKTRNVLRKRRFIKRKSLPVKYFKFRWSCFVSQRVSMKKIAIRSQFWTICNDETQYLLVCLTGKWLWGCFFLTKNLLCRRKTRRKFHVYGERETRVEIATGKRDNGREILVTWSLLPFVFHVNLMLK